MSELDKIRKNDEAFFNSIRRKRFLITVRPWRASGGSSVHDEAIHYQGEDARECLMKLYEDKEYDFSEFRVIDIQEERA